MIRLTVPGVPVAKGSYRAVRGRLLTSTSSRHEAAQRLWHDTICAAVHQARGGCVPFERGPVFVGLVFGFPLRLKHFDRAGLLRADTPWLAEELDVDKCTRLVLDALTDARAWRDDKQAHVLAAKVYRAPGQALESDVILGAEPTDVIAEWQRALGRAALAMHVAIGEANEQRAARKPRRKEAA